MSVSAVIVTRGDVPLDEIVASLEAAPSIDDIVIWNNDVRENLKTWGRHAALAECRNRLIYSQDDDVLHSADAIERIIDCHEPGVLTGCMWREWSDRAAEQDIEGGYSDLAFPGAGSVYDREVPLMAATRYLEHFPDDDFFRTWCDAIIGVIAPSAWIDERFFELPAGDNTNRIAHLPNAPALKRKAIMRARTVRDSLAKRDEWMASLNEKRDAHDLYMRDLDERLRRQAW